MTASEFNRLSFTAKTDIVTKLIDTKFIGVRRSEHFVIGLTQLDNFYIEVWYSSGEPVDIRGVENKNLHPDYLKQIKVPGL